MTTASTSSYIHPDDLYYAANSSTSSYYQQLAKAHLAELEEAGDEGVGGGEKDGNAGEGDDRLQDVIEEEGGEEEEEVGEEPLSHMQEVIPGLWIGDYIASQDFEGLRRQGIGAIVSAMKQKYPIPDVGHSLGPFPSRQQVSTAALNKKTIIAIQQDFKIHRIPVDDTNKANIMAHFPEATEFINSNLDPSTGESMEEGEGEVDGENPGEGSAEVEDGKRRGGVLVHCQAGVSRSTSLVAAYLMKEKGVTCDEAIEMISSARSIVQPTEFFLHQLEMYERCGCQVDGAKWPEYRRFLMNFMAEDIMDGDGIPSLVLAYYPSPGPTPISSPAIRNRSPSDPFRSLAMTPIAFASSHIARRGSHSSVSSIGSMGMGVERRGSVGPGIAERRGSAGSGSGSGIRRTMSGGSSGGGSSVNANAARERERFRSNLLSAGGMTYGSGRSSGGSGSGSESPGVEVSSDLQGGDGGPSSGRPGLAATTVTVSQSGVGDAQRDLLDAEKDGNVIKVGKGRVVIQGRRIRCKMCRRELAAREHVVSHEVGQGQQAFAPHRRDMTQHRLDQQRLREEQAKREQAKREYEAKMEERRKAFKVEMEVRNRMAAESDADTDKDKDEVVGSESADTAGADSPSDASSPATTGAGASRPETGTGSARSSSSTGSTSLSDRIPRNIASSLRVAMPPRQVNTGSPNLLSSADFTDSAIATTPEPSPVPRIIPGVAGATTSQLQNPLNRLTISPNIVTPSPLSPPLLPSSTCTSYFVEPLSWMSEELEKGNLGGKIVCPNSKCGAKLGNYDWAGLQCSCGSWVVPGFMIQKSKVDEVVMR